MTQEDKELLLKDLCARLPYEVKIQHIIYGTIGKVKSVYFDLQCVEIGMKDKHYDVPIEEIIPYLRSMSSMSEEERIELMRLYDFTIVDDEEDIRHGIRIIDEISGNLYPVFIDFRAINWLYEHHFDFLGLIKKGLTLEAPEGMYNYE